MAGQDIGYIRVSSVDQNEQRQLVDVKLDKIFIDKTSGKDTNRPSLTEMINYARDGDIIHVHSIDRLARNLIDLKSIIQSLVAKNVSIKFYKENLFFSKSSNNPMDNLLLSILGAFAEFERSIIKERQREGIRLAKEKGTYTGRMPTLTKSEVKYAASEKKRGVPLAEIARQLKVSRTTLYRYLKDIDKWKMSYKKEDETEGESHDQVTVSSENVYDDEKS